ncbi:inorganic phosphate transporter [Candidatus Similichlamydia epinepheli]|uniref:inorganic phosphate transporter n=1 Tax=Candidatus Similichlamydia epinepheli TaxID=1903953 RepID=UPI000D38284D|nr:inorganic phosphate transporter [Candidatus Similichlamydia epinepheli]
MAWNIGASDIANAMGTSVGAKALSLRQAVLIAAGFEFLGAFLCGHEVIQTLNYGIINLESLQTESTILAIGMNSSLLAAGIWLQIASYFGWPVSTTHTIVGALTGFGLFLKGKEAIQWSTLLAISSFWVFSPILGAILSFLLFAFFRIAILKAKHPLKQAERWVPLLCSLFALCAISILTIRLPSLPSSFMVGAVAISVLSYLGSYVIIKRKRRKPPIKCTQEDMEINIQIQNHVETAINTLQEAKELSTKREWVHELHQRTESLEQLKSKIISQRTKHSSGQEEFLVEQDFSFLQISSAALMAFAHGSNDIANAAGPLLLGIKSIYQPSYGHDTLVNFILLWTSIGMIVGLATWGWRVIQTVGKKITELTPSRGFAAELGCAVTVLIASKLQMPISTTHTLIGSLIGIGLARGAGNLNVKTIQGIFLSWIVTIPTGAVLCWLIFYLIKPTLLSF